MKIRAFVAVRDPVVRRTLANADGQVIGVAAMIVAGMALAVPAPDVEALVASSG